MSHYIGYENVSTFIQLINICMLLVSILLFMRKGYYPGYSTAGLFRLISIRRHTGLRAYKEVVFTYLAP